MSSVLSKLAPRALHRRFRMMFSRGVYPTFQAAEAAVPAGRHVGYDNADSAAMYLESHDSVRPTDYAVFYWMGPLLLRHPGVFDFGGHVGRLYYPYRKYLEFPAGMRWLICDVPAVVDAGRRLAAERQAEHLEFCVDFADVDGFDILFTSGTLQYVEKDLATLLGGVPRKPSHVIVNRVPLSSSPTYYTVQDHGSACCAYRIANRDEFIASMKSVGYELVDSWRCPESSLRILFRPDRRLKFYSGLYFRLAGASASD